MNNLKQKTIFFLLVFIYGFLVFLFADSSLGFNTIPLSKSLNKVAFTIAPQGWGFFTRDPKEPLIDMYELNGGNQMNKVSIPNSSLKYFWGFDRGMRFSSSQIGYLINQIPSEKWVSNPSHQIDSLMNSIQPFSILNDFSYPVHCGKFLLTKTDRIPWAWSKHRDNIKMPRSIVIIDIKCNIND